MGLSKLTISTLKACAPILENHKKALGQTFYKRLFQENPQLRNQFNMSNTMTQGNALSNAVVAFCGNCDRLETLGPTLAQVTNKHVSLEVTPDQYNVVGLTLLASLEDVLGKEVFNGQVKDAVAEGYFFLADIFKEEEAKLIADRISAKGGWHGWRSFKLARKEPETSLHTSFYFTPKDGGETTRFAGGQYTSIRLRLANFDHLLVRSYTLTGGTTEHDGYRITVKREDGGVVSQYLHDKMQIGESLELSAPAGVFTLQQGPKPRVFIGGGTGITPLMSMLRESARDFSTPAFLLYRAHHPRLHPLRDELHKLIESNRHITCAVNYTKEGDHQVSPSTKRMTVLPPSTPWTAEAIGPLIPSGCQVYLCGPPPFTGNTLNLLNQVGMKQDNIFYECFGPQT